MRKRYGLLAFLSVFVAACAIYNGVAFFFAADLPMSLRFVDAQTAEVNTLPGVPLPAPLVSGDRIDLGALDATARSAMVLYFGGRTLPLGRTYELAVRRSDGLIRVSVTTISSSSTLRWHWLEGVAIANALLLGVMSLLLLWFGHNRASQGMALWSMGYVFGVSLNSVHLDDNLGVVCILLSGACFVLARSGFYLMAESLVGGALSIRLRLLFRMVFILLLALGAAQNLGGLALLAATGWAGLALPKFSVLFSWVYIVPIIMLFVGSRHVDMEQRVRLRWVTWSAVGIMFAVTITNAVPFSVAAATSLSYFAFTTGACGFMYSLLRHRVVDFSVVMDRALVYGGVTTLVVGIIAAMNSLALRATLGEGTGLLLQIVVPLSLGIVLGKVRVYMDMLVERVFFRSKYLAEKALRTFARRCGHIEDVPRLLDAAVKEIQKHTASPAVAIYAESEAGYVLLNKSKGARYPGRLKADDSVLVAIRAEQESIELAELESALGAEGRVFPMMVLGVLRGVLVCANRPGEHYASDEKKLLMQVATDVAAAWRILRARENEAFVRAVARGEIKLNSVKARAKSLEQAWTRA